VKDSQSEVDVLSVQIEGFVHAHPGHPQETEKSCKRAGAQPLGRWELLCLAKEPFESQCRYKCEESGVDNAERECLQVESQSEGLWR
jgi:hypothetical protein